jgi:catechol 2,3-dioxygenase-like lactoylglutathione lyase family enzyme
MLPDRVLETALYTSDLRQTTRFYTEVLGLELLKDLGEQGVALACGGSVVILFDPARTAAQPGEVPAHGSSGAGHVAFAVPNAELRAWRTHLERAGVAIESEVDWPRGGSSIYFRDPAGNSVELTTPAIWGLPER